MMKRLKDFDVYQIYRKWNYGSGPFRCFFRSTNFVSLKHYPDFELLDVVEESENSKAKNVVDKFDKKTTAFVVDLPSEGSIKAAFALQKDSIHPILTFNSPLHPFGMIGGEKYISCLLKFGDKLEKIEPQSFAFILDQNRYGEYSDEDYRKFFNNQYELTDEDLPPVEMLQDLGFQRLVYIYSNEIKEDIEGYISYLLEQDFLVIKEKLIV